MYRVTHCRSNKTTHWPAGCEYEMTELFLYLYGQRHTGQLASLRFKLLGMGIIGRS
jgi:hypothetical protein